MSLVDILDHLESVDDEMEKEASEFEKIAAEEEAAGRIMARGFMDELDKLAQMPKMKELPKMQKTQNKAPPKSMGVKLPQQSRTPGYTAPPAGQPYAGSRKAKVGPGAGTGRLGL